MPCLDFGLCLRIKPRFFRVVERGLENRCYFVVSHPGHLCS
jgi:hypothetical protein